LETKPRIQFLPDFPLSACFGKTPFISLVLNFHGRKGTIMSAQLTNYLWFEPYLNAICETDETMRPGRILEARSAIEQRLLSPVTPGSDEERAIRSAQVGLSRLIAERANRPYGLIDDSLEGLRGVTG
jgi:hypothetical protein